MRGFDRFWSAGLLLLLVGSSGLLLWPLRADWGNQQAIILFARASGLLSLSLLLLASLAVCRSRLLDAWWGRDRLLRLHRAATLAGLLLAIVHPLLFAYQYGTAFLFADFYRSGRWALWIILASVLLALLRGLLRLPYHWWRWLHKLSVVGVVLALIHAEAAGTVLATWPGRIGIGLQVLIAGLCVLQRQSMLLRARAMRVEAVERLSEVDTRLLLRPESEAPWQARAAQHIFISPTRRGLCYDDHPFTLIGADNAQPEILVRDLGDFTRRLSAWKVGQRLWIDGPYGRLHGLWKQAPQALICIAGGVGITPMIALLRQRAQLPEQSRPPTLLITLEKNDARAPFDDQLRAWAAEDPGLSLCLLRGRHSLQASALHQEAQHLLPQAHAVVCGPAAMMADATQILRDWGIPQSRIFQEHFAL